VVSMAIIIVCDFELYILNHFSELFVIASWLN